MPPTSSLTSPRARVKTVGGHGGIAAPDNQRAREDSAPEQQGYTIS